MFVWGRPPGPSGPVDMLALSREPVKAPVIIARLRIAEDRQSSASAAEPVVVLLGVPVRLVEAEVVREVVHAVVDREQVRDGGVDVVARSGSDPTTGCSRRGTTRS